MGGVWADDEDPATAGLSVQAGNIAPRIRLGLRGLSHGACHTMLVTLGWLALHGKSSGYNRLAAGRAEKSNVRSRLGGQRMLTVGWAAASDGRVVWVVRSGDLYFTWFMEFEMFTYGQEDGVDIVYFENTRILDEATVQTLGTELFEAAARAKNGKLLLNFRNVLLMSSSIINKLVELRNRCEKAGMHLAFCEVSENVQEVFRLMKMQNLVNIYPDEPSAIDAMQDL